MNVNTKVFLMAVSGLCILASCAPQQKGVDVAEVRALVNEDLSKVYQHGAIEAPLRLEDVLARALVYNLDTKVAEMDELIAADDVSLEQLRSLPSVTGKIQRVGRSNTGGSSSFSLLTGTQSLQESVSTEQYRNVGQLTMEWNLLDAGINLWRAKSASDRVLIAQERRRKVYHGVVQDAYSAFWRVAIAQQSLPILDGLLMETNEQLARIEQQIEQNLVPLGEAQGARSTIRAQREQLINMKQGLDLAEIELKTLIDYPLDEPIVLATGGKNLLSGENLPKIKGDIAKFEETAFLNRPEIREELLNKRISTRDMKMVIWESLPGIELLFTYNYDSNKYLAYNNWIDGIVGLTQSINKIITAPARYDRAENVDLLADKRRQALIAAVITQIHVAKARYDALSEIYDENEKSAEDAKEILERAYNYKGVGLMSDAELLNVKIDSTITLINRAFAFSEVQDAYGRFVTTMGVDLWDADDAGLSVPDYAKQIRKNLDDDNLFVMTALNEGEAS
ncbi:MAG TPA: TolC family protein [Micavibrio sp.]|nr:TolC family protein [Micavibrio sp.]HIL27883.1 TolC family protein [Micavibrio sp.]